MLPRSGTQRQESHDYLAGIKSPLDINDRYSNAITLILLWFVSQPLLAVLTPKYNQ